MVAAPLVFLLSPAKASGKRAELLRSEGASFALASQLRSRHGALLGELFSFLSSLYFRGKLRYAQRFAAPPPGVPGSLIITPGAGLRLDTTPVTLAAFEQLAQVAVDASNPAFVEPLLRDAVQLRALTPNTCRFVLLGSIATGKYVDPLLTVFGESLLFPRAFVGRGDMSRGGLMLRCARSGEELEYVAVASSERKGGRAARIAPARKSSLP